MKIEKLLYFTWFVIINWIHVKINCKTKKCNSNINFMQWLHTIPLLNILFIVMFLEKELDVKCFTMDLPTNVLSLKFSLIPH